MDIKGKTVLVVDDDPGILKAISRLIKFFCDGRIVTAADGEAALKIAEDEAIDLVITDWQMPKLDGLGLIWYLKKLEKPPKIIFMSASEKPVFAEAIRFGADACIGKPFDNADFKEKIDSL